MLRSLLVLLAAATAATTLAAVHSGPVSCPAVVPAGCSCKISEGRPSISCVATPRKADLPKSIPKKIEADEAAAAATDINKLPPTQTAPVTPRGDANPGNSKHASPPIDSRRPGQALVNHLLPGMSLINGLAPAGQQAAAGLGQMPGLGAFLSNIPSLRSLGGVGGVPGAAAMPAGSVRSMNTAIEQFAAPFVRFATGGQPQAADIEQLMQSIPKMIEAGGAAAAIDISKLPPDLIAHVMRGGAIPGISKETVDNIVSKHIRKMAEVAAAIARGETPEDVAKYLPPLERLPAELITNVMSGQSLPSLTQEEMESIKQYYLNTLPLSSPADHSSFNGNGTPSSLDAPPVLPTFPLTPQTLEMMRLLPAGYNISRIPIEIMEAISKGQVPDLRLLPADLQEHLKTNTDKMLNMFQAGGGQEGGASMEDMREVVSKLPHWDRPIVETVTYSPYDLNDVKTDVKAEEKAVVQARMYRLMTAGGIGLLAVVTVIVVVSMCLAQRQKILRGDWTGGSSIDTLRANAHSTPSILANQRELINITQPTGIIHRRSPQQNI